MVMERVILKKVLFIVIVHICLPSMLCAGYYKWKDGNGNVHFTDNYYAVPQEFRTSLDQDSMVNVTEMRPFQAILLNVW